MVTIDYTVNDICGDYLIDYSYSLMTLSIAEKLRDNLLSIDFGISPEAL